MLILLKCGTLYTGCVCDGQHRKCGGRAQEDTPPQLTVFQTCFCGFSSFIGLINTRVSTNLLLRVAVEFVLT